MMKRIFFFIAVAMALVCDVHAARVDEMAARQVADNFFSAKSTRLKAPGGPQSATRLVYTAEQERFYVFDRGVNSGFVVVAGDDRLPQVLAYGAESDFSQVSLPSNVQYWVDEMNRQIEYLQSHDGAVAYKPAPRATEVQPLMKSHWDQGAPYNDQCPTYNDGTARAVTGCVATAMAQIMNYHQWPDVGRGSHSYNCNVNGSNRVTLSADYSQSVYRWDLMLNDYYPSSAPESCEAVAKLMSDVGIAVNMGYGSSSGAQETEALEALKTYFKYTNKAYLLHRDYYGADEWDQIMVDEIAARRPVLYCGYSMGVSGYEGHAFVLDGFDTDGYYHVNWGWGGTYDGYFLVSVLAPMSGTDFKIGQDGIFGVVPENRASEVDDVLYVRSQLLPLASAVPLGGTAEFNLSNLMIEGNDIDTVGYHQYGNRKFYYTNMDLCLAVFDSNGGLCHSATHSIDHILSDWFMQDDVLDLDLPTTLRDGEYKIKMNYLSPGETQSTVPQYVRDFSGKDLYVKMVVRDGVAYLSDCFLGNTYEVSAFVVPRGITTGEPFTVGVDLSYETWSDGVSPVGNVYLSILKDGVEMGTSNLYEVSVANNTTQTYEMQITAPDEWGVYDLVLNDESGGYMMRYDSKSGDYVVSKSSIFVLPPCHEMLEDFESMTANSATNDKGVQGQFTSWDFTKCGVRAPGEDNCNGTNAVMMKKPSIITSSVPVSGDFFMAQAIFYNPSSSLSKYRLEYSVDGGATWQKVYTFDGQETLEVPATSQVLANWTLHINEAQHALFRITMFGGGSAATYLDDFCLYYTDPRSDVNKDGEVNLADINTIVDAIFAQPDVFYPTADVNQDGEINLADINTVINLILSR